MAFLGKEYKYEGEENYVNFIKSTGLPENLIAEILQCNANSKLVKNGDVYSSISITPEGVSEDKIATYLEYNPSTKLVKNGDTYTCSTWTPGGISRETTFKSGVEFDDSFLDKLKIKTTYIVDGNTVTQAVNSDLGTAEFKREYNGDDLVVTITGSKFDGVAKRYYKA